MNELEQHIKLGNIIHWSLSGHEAVVFGEQHKAKIVHIDEDEEECGVYPTYGQDLIPFKDIYQITDADGNTLWTVL